MFESWQRGREGGERERKRKRRREREQGGERERKRGEWKTESKHRDNKNIGRERKGLVFMQCVHDSDQAASWYAVFPPALQDMRPSKLAHPESLSSRCTS